MNESKNLLSLAEAMTHYAKQKGAAEVEVTIASDNQFSVDVRKGEIEKLVEAGSKELSIRLFKDQKTATIRSSDLNIDTLHRMIDNAIKRADLSSPDPFAGLPKLTPQETKFVEYKKLNIFDPAIAELAPEKKIALARETEAICLKDKRIVNSYGASFNDSSGETILVNSNGFSGSYRSTECGLGIFLQAGEGDNKVDDGWNESEHYIDQLWSPEKIANTALQRVTRLIGARKIATQTVPVILEPDMTGSILSFLFQCLRGRAIYMKQSFLVDQLDQKIANDKITIIDDGLLPGGPGTVPFDGEGVPLRKWTVVDHGVLKTYLTDTYSGRKLNMHSTGHASGANNFSLEKGTLSPEEIIKSVDKGLLLTNTMGQGTNTTTGDFSRGAFGLWIEKGEIAYPVAEITISGNLSQMLKNMDMIGNDLRLRRSISGPTVRIAEMTVAGL